MSGKVQYYPASTSPALTGDDDSDIAMSAEDWMDREFGRGAWVRDRSCDRFITLDPDHCGPGVGYLVIDRQLRRLVSVVYPYQVN